MATYRIYTIGHDGRPVNIEMISAASDEEARAIAQARLKKTDLEVWTGTRRVCAIPAGKDT